MAEQKKDKVVSEGTFFALISYIGFLCIVSLVLKKNNKFALYHAKQGLVLFVFEVGAFIISIIPILGWFLGIGTVIFALVSLWSILQALMGNYHRIPFVSGIADKITI
ncbi:MAG: hypothetical protein KJ793_00650 [Candidatus Omnitrophica bacterium]|nr:hypothetical protein [Candidatus Omnitrophota bacterium]